eukprot:Hpha_TRINITY_DN34994_c0_g1::TRINITY_DN34994_c0_g1_i1::g.184099::m.184099
MALPAAVLLAGVGAGVADNMTRVTQQASISQKDLLGYLTGLPDYQGQPHAWMTYDITGGGQVNPGFGMLSALNKNLLDPNAGLSGGKDLSVLQCDLPDSAALVSALGGISASTAAPPAVSAAHWSYGEAAGTCYVDFANQQLGGNVLVGGAAQEENMLQQLTNAAVFIARSWYGANATDFEPLGHQGAGGQRWVLSDKGGAVIISGAYGSSVVPWRALSVSGARVPATGPYTVVAVNAMNAAGAKGQAYTEDEAVWQVSKFYTAFARSSCSTVLTGGVGCGMFANNPSWIYALQWIASAAAGVKLDYRTSPDPSAPVQALLQTCAPKTLGDVLKSVVKQGWTKGGVATFDPSKC